MHTDAGREWLRQGSALFKLVTQKRVIISTQERERGGEGREEEKGVIESFLPFSCCLFLPLYLQVWRSDTRRDWAHRARETEEREREREKERKTWRNNKAIISSSGWHLYCPPFLFSPPTMSCLLFVYPFLHFFSLDLLDCLLSRKLSPSIQSDLSLSLSLFSLICLSVNLFFFYPSPLDFVSSLLLSFHFP